MPTFRQPPALPQVRKRKSRATAEVSKGPAGVRQKWYQQCGGVVRSKILAGRGGMSCNLSNSNEHAMVANQLSERPNK